MNNLDSESIAKFVIRILQWQYLPIKFLITSIRKYIIIKKIKRKKSKYASYAKDVIKIMLRG
jgi:hypothetical protein